MLITSIVLPFIAFTISPGFVALPPGMFSVAGTMPTTLSFGFSLPIADIAAITRGAAGHVVLHLFHALGGLDRDAAGIERDALADEREQLFARWVAVIAHDDELGRLHAALRDREKRAHALLARARFVEDLDLEPGLLCDGAASSAKRVGVMSLAGVMANRRARLTASPSDRPARDAALEFGLVEILRNDRRRSSSRCGVPAALDRASCRRLR